MANGGLVYLFFRRTQRSIVSKKSKKNPIKVNIVEMPPWKAKMLNGLAWLLGLKGEKAYVITISENNE